MAMQIAKAVGDYLGRLPAMRERMPAIRPWERGVKGRCQLPSRNALRCRPMPFDSKEMRWPSSLFGSAVSSLYSKNFPKYCASLKILSLAYKASRPSWPGARRQRHA